MTFEVYLAAFALGRVPTSQLPAAAMQALEEGHDSPALAALAGTMPSERSPSQVEEMWRLSLRELGVAVPGRVKAGHLLKRYFAGLVSSGEVPPRDGALEIIELGRDLSPELPDSGYAGDGFGIAKLLGIYYSHDDVPPDDARLHDEIDEQLKAECERLAGEGHRRVVRKRRLSTQIRPYRLDDAEAVVDAVRESLAEAQQWMPWCHPQYSVSDSRSWLEAQVPAFRAGTAFEFAIVSADGAYVGGCGLNQIDKINRRANLGYWVRSTATGQGVATAAVRALRDWAFEATDLVRLEIVVAVGNAASHRVAEKVGAAREGTLIRRLVLHGALSDATMFSLTRDLPVCPEGTASAAV